MDDHGDDEGEEVKEEGDLLLGVFVCAIEETEQWRLASLPVFIRLYARHNQLFVESSIHVFIIDVFSFTWLVATHHIVVWLWSSFIITPGAGKLFSIRKNWLKEGERFLKSARFARFRLKPNIKILNFTISFVVIIIIAVITFIYFYNILTNSYNSLLLFFVLITIVWILYFNVKLLCKYIIYYSAVGYSHTFRNRYLVSCQNTPRLMIRQHMATGMISSLWCSSGMLMCHIIFLHKTSSIEY